MVQQDLNLDGAAESENEKKGESTSLPQKHPPQNQPQVDSLHTTSNSRPAAPVNSKKSATKSEVCFVTKSV